MEIIHFIIVPSACCAFCYVKAFTLVGAVLVVLLAMSKYPLLLVQKYEIKHLVVAVTDN